MIFGAYKGPILVEGLPLCATMVMGLTLTWYLNPIYATHLMMATMSQFRPLITPIKVPPYTVQPTMTLGLGPSYQNLAIQNLVSQNLMSRILVSQM